MVRNKGSNEGTEKRPDAGSASHRAAAAKAERSNRKTGERRKENEGVHHRRGNRGHAATANGQAQPDQDRKKRIVLSATANAREVALHVLTRIDVDDAYSNLLLNQSLQQSRLNRQDSALATELVYGTLQRLNTIDFFLSRFVAKGLDKLEPWVRNLLRLSLYQLHWLERIPEHAAVSEAVAIAKRRGHQGISGMVNAVLRSAVRQKSALVVPAGLPAADRISLEHSHPKWIVSRWIAQFGEETTEAVCRSNNLPPKVSVRVNALKQTRESMLQKLLEQGIAAEASAIASAGVIVTSGGNMALSEWYQNGELSIQDESSMLVAEAVDPKPGMHVLDCCAAPGGKTAHMAERMNDTGRIWAADLHEHKRQLIEEQSRRLGLTCIRTLTEDARKLPEHFALASFERILLDAPCSGLGVIRRKPDVKWSKQAGDISEIAELQYEILSQVQRLLRPDGVLVYGTCTLSSEENEELMLRFLREHRDFELSPLPEHPLHDMRSRGMAYILPHEYRSDGFFIARIKRKKII